MVFIKCFIISLFLVHTASVSILPSLVIGIYLMLIFSLPYKLEKLLHDRNISINKLMRDTNTDFKVIKRIMTGDIVRIDTNVLARLCDYLECSLTDIIDYIN